MFLRWEKWRQIDKESYFWIWKIDHLLKTEIFDHDF